MRATVARVRGGPPGGRRRRRADGRQPRPACVPARPSALSRALGAARPAVLQRAVATGQRPRRWQKWRTARRARRRTRDGRAYIHEVWTTGEMLEPVASSTWPSPTSATTGGITETARSRRWRRRTRCRRAAQPEWPGRNHGLGPSGRGHPELPDPRVCAAATPRRGPARGCRWRRLELPGRPWDRAGPHVIAAHPYEPGSYEPASGRRRRGGSI